MARLPSEKYLMQDIGGTVILFEDFTEREIVRFDPADRDEVAKAQKVIHDSWDLSEEDKCFAHLWSGYFHAHATGVGSDRPVQVHELKLEPGEDLFSALKRITAPLGPDTSQSMLPGTQWGINVARRNGPAAELTAEQRSWVESDLQGACDRIEAEHGFVVKLIPRPQWETTGLVAHADEITDAISDLSAFEDPGGRR